MKNGHHFVKNKNFGGKNETLLGKSYLHYLTKFQINRTFLASVVKRLTLQSFKIISPLGWTFQL